MGKKVNIEKIRELHPDIIIANKEENTPEIVAELQSIAPVWVTEIISIEDALEMISDFGRLFNCRTEAKKWCEKIDFAYREFQDFVADEPIRKVAYFIWKNPYMAAGEDNFINEMLKLNRFTNIYDNNSRVSGRYPEVIIQRLSCIPSMIVVLVGKSLTCCLPMVFRQKLISHCCIR